MVDSSIPLGEWSGSAATRELHATIKEFNAAATQHTAVMLRLTRWILALTVVMSAAVVVQIVITLGVAIDTSSRAA